MNLKTAMTTTDYTDYTDFQHVAVTARRAARGTRVALAILLWLGMPGLGRADGSPGESPHLHLTLRRNLLGTEALLSWDGAGSLEQSTNLGPWRKVSTATRFTGGRTRSVVVDLGQPSREQFFRLRLPEPADVDHLHVVREDLFPYSAGQQVELVDPSWTLSRRLPVHQVRIHAIRTADTNGSYPATISASEISQIVSQSNTIFFRAGVEFLFDSATDLQDIDNTDLNRDVRAPNADSSYTNANSNPTALGVTTNDAPKRARAEEALRHKGKLVVFFRYQKDGWQWNGTHWIPKPTGWGSSSWAGTHVNMPPDDIGLNHLAHELGHYLQNMHPFAGEFTLAQAEARMEAGLASAEVTADTALDVFDGDGYWVRDTAPDPSQDAFPGDGCSTATITLNVDTDPGSGVSMRAYTAAPDRLNLLSYFGNCESLGTRRLTSDMMDRLRDGLENSIRHPLISQHIAGSFTANVTLADTYSGSLIGSGMQLLRTRWDLLVAVYRTTGGTLRLLSLAMDDTGDFAVQDSLNTGITGDSVAAVNMGLGLVAISIGSNSVRPEFHIYRVHESGTWQHLSSLVSDNSLAGPVTMTRCGRVNFVTGHSSLGTNTNCVLRLFETDAKGLIHLQDQTQLRPGSSLSLGVVRATFLVTAMRNQDGDLEILSFSQSGERGANELVPVDQKFAGAIASVTLIANEHDRFVTAVRTGSGALKLILWAIDFDGKITRVANGTDGTANDFVTAGLAGSDIIATAARTTGDVLSLRLWSVNPAGTFSDLITNGSEIQAIDAFDSLALQLVRDRYVAVGRRLSSGAMQIRSYRFTP